MNNSSLEESARAIRMFVEDEARLERDSKVAAIENLEINKQTLQVIKEINENVKVLSDIRDLLEVAEENNIEIRNDLMELLSAKSEEEGKKIFNKIMNAFEGVNTIGDVAIKIVGLWTILSPMLVGIS